MKCAKIGLYKDHVLSVSSKIHVGPRPPRFEGAVTAIAVTGGVSYRTNDTPSVFACGEATSLKEGGKDLCIIGTHQQTDTWHKGAGFLKEKVLYGLWLCLYILSVGLGTVTERGTAAQIVFTALSLLFFVPGALLLWDSIQSGSKKKLLRIRLISLASLLLTVSLIVLNILCVTAGDTVGQVLNDLLILVSAPMFCCHWQWLSLFLWACLFVSSFPRIWKK